MCGSVSLLLISACVFFTCCSAQTSCSGRCGEAYSRGSQCQCDYECLSHSECCKDYEPLCTSRGSCKGRCGEMFKRGRQCHCDIECIKYKQCCSDYETQCITEDSEEEYNELAVTTPVGEVSAEDAVSGSKPLPSDMTELSDPAEYQTTPLLTLPVSGTVPSVTASPVPEENPEHPQDSSEPEQIPPNSTILDISPATTNMAVSDQLPDQYPNPTNPADSMPESEEPDPTAETTTPLTAEPQTTEADDNPEAPASTPASENTDLVEPTYSTSVPSVLPEITSSRPDTTPSYQSTTVHSQTTSDTKPTPPSTPQDNNPDLNPEDREDPEVDLGNQTEAQLEPGENPTSESPVQELGSTDKPTTGEITEPQSENQSIKDVFPTTDSPTYPNLVKTTPASVTINSSPTEAQEKFTKPENDQNNHQDHQENQADTQSDTNLCSGLPVNGLTTLRNSTIVVFRGHYFWMLDSRRNAGPARLIKDYWGVPSPIDTVFTRCNCQGKTYIFRGDKYWRFENDVMDADFPRPISEGFGLGGRIVAALSMPQYRSRRESVFFFKKGGLAQRYSYLNTPSCGRQGRQTVVKRRYRKEAAPELGQEFLIHKTWVGFPPTVTSAVSVRTTRGDGYKYYMFSETKYYSLKMEGDTPVILTPKAGQEKQNSAKSWFKCPEISVV